MKRPWMPLYVADYLNDTVHLTTAEHGAYLLLLMYYWTHGGLPDDENAIRRITKMSKPNWKRCGKTVLDFFPCVSDSRHNSRADRELAKAIEKSSVNSANAKRKHSDRSANAHTLTKKESKTSFGKELERPPPVDNSKHLRPSSELIASELKRRPRPPSSLATAHLDSALPRSADTAAELPSEASKPNGGSNPERPFSRTEAGKPEGWDLGPPRKKPAKVDFAALLAEPDDSQEKVA